MKILLVTPMDLFRRLSDEQADEYVSRAVEAVERVYPQAWVEHRAQGAVTLRAELTDSDYGDDERGVRERESVEQSALDCLEAAWDRIYRA